jgi:hypothetical protein
MRSSRIRKIFVVAVFVFGVVGVSGCEGESTVASDIEDRYVMAFLDGFWVGYKFIRANDFDPVTMELIDVRIEDGSSIIHADRAEILIDTESKTVSLRLYGIVGADPKTGSLIEIPEFTTEPKKIKVEAGE